MAMDGDSLTQINDRRVRARSDCKHVQADLAQLSLKIHGASGRIKINSLPKDKILDCSKLKVFADDKTNVTQHLKFVME